MPWLLILLILLLVGGWHFIFSFLGGVLILGAAGIFIAILSVVMFCVAVVMSLFLPGIVGLIIGAIFVVWTMIAVVLAPVLFPILLPLLIILAFLEMRIKKNTLTEKKQLK